MRERVHRITPAGRRSRASLAAISLVSLALGVAAFTTTRALRDAGPEAVADGPVPQPSAEARGLPNTSIEGWAPPIKEKERLLPRYDQTIAGIQILVSGHAWTAGPCKPGEAQWTTPERGDASDLAIRPAAFPAGSREDPFVGENIECAGEVVYTARFYVTPQDEAGFERYRSGAASWFDIEHSGRYHVLRVRYPVARVVIESVPSEQWTGGTIAGLPAAIGRPILPGFGNAAVITWDWEREIITIVTATDRPIEEVVRVAEELVR